MKKQAIWLNIENYRLKKNEMLANTALLDRYRFGEITGLIDVGALEHGDVIGQQLQGYGKHNGCHTVIGRRNRQHRASFVG